MTVCAPVVRKHLAGGVAHSRPTDGSEHSQLEVCNETDWTAQQGGHEDSRHDRNGINSGAVIFFLRTLFLLLLFLLFLLLLKAWLSGHVLPR